MVHDSLAEPVLSEAILTSLLPWELSCTLLERPFLILSEGHLPFLLASFPIRMFVVSESDADPGGPFLWPQSWLPTPRQQAGKGFPRTHGKNGFPKPTYVSPRPQECRAGSLSKYLLSLLHVGPRQAWVFGKSDPLRQVPSSMPCLDQGS